MRKCFFPSWDVINTMNMHYEAWVKKGEHKEEKHKGKLTEKCLKLKDVS